MSNTNIPCSFVHTPLWTDYPEKMKQFGYSIDNAVTADEVAAGMMELVTSGEHSGGACLQVARGHKRTLGVWNIPAPNGTGATVDPAVLEENYRPALEMIRSG